MPQGNGTGPMGMGSKTGRAAGLCAGFGNTGYANSPGGRSFGVCYGRGLNAGRGLRRRFLATGLSGLVRFGGSAHVPYRYMVADQVFGSDIEKQALKNRAELLESELDTIRRRLSGMDKEDEK